MLRVGALEVASSTAQNLDLVARVRALETVQYYSNGQTQSRSGQYSWLFRVVDSFGQLICEDTAATNSSAVGFIHGFEQVVADRIEVFREMFDCELSSHASMMVAVRT